MAGTSNFWPAIAVPITVKMPEPMTAPMPSAVSDQGPSVFFSACSGSSESWISLSIDLRASSWLASLISPRRSGCGRRQKRHSTGCALPSGSECLRRSVQDEVPGLERKLKIGSVLIWLAMHLAK